MFSRECNSQKMQFLDQNVKSHDATQNLITNIDDKQL